MASGRIDVHFHAVPQAYREAVAAAALGPTARLPDWTPEAALELMDRNGIASAITSISTPGLHFGDPDKARRLARQCNDAAADLATRWPRRFGAFAALPLPDVDASCAEIEHALDTLRLDGVGLFTSYDGRHLGDPVFDPVLAALNERGAAAFAHPTYHACAHLLQPAVPGFLVEFLFETTRAAVSLVLSGALDRFPRIRFILAHGGGTLPFVSWRMAYIAWRQLTQPATLERFPLPLVADNLDQFSAETVLSRLRRFWYDTALAAGPAAFGSLREIAAPERILFGSDWPYAPEVMTRDMIANLGAPGFLGLTELAAIERGNALRLFPRFG